MSKAFDTKIIETESLWDTLALSHIPVVLYGMGDGAVKLLSILKKRGITPVGIFASDEFVRYNSFCGYTVKKLSDIEEEFRDFIVLVAFATHLDTVREHIFEISKKHTLFIPDINVTGDPLEVFDKAFFNENRHRLEAVYDRLDTDRSKNMFAALVNFKLSGKLYYLEEIERYRQEDTLPYDAAQIESFADLGAYNGDTLNEAFNTYPNLKKAVCFEPDPKTFKKLKETANALPVDTKTVNALAHNENTELELYAASGRNTVVKKQAYSNASMQKKKSVLVGALRPDSVTDFVPHLIKMDVEGCEMQALEGCEGFFKEHSPILRISIYHNNRHLFEIAEKLERIKKGYKLAISQKCTYIPAWDIELVAYNS